MADTKIERLRQQRDQINARIQRESNKERQRERKERNSRLVQWGIVIEQMLEDGRMSPDKWADECRRYLTKPRDLERALSGKLADFSQEQGGQSAQNITNN